MHRIPESFLRQVWQNQHFSTSDLHTADGKSVRIIFPGVPNNDGGPDFCDARIQIGHTTFCGDVELHRHPQEWESHAHHSNQRYNRVILHVVLTADPLTRPPRTLSKRLLPLLVLHPYLDETLRATWMRTMDHEDGSAKKIPCFDLNGDVPAGMIARWIGRLAQERMEMKIRRFEGRVKELIDEHRGVVQEPYPRYFGNPGEIPLPARELTRRDIARKELWEQLLYEALMEGLGYSKNTEPFLILSQSLQLSFLREHGSSDPALVMAILFGAAGLLPPRQAMADAPSRAYVRNLRRLWKGIRPLYRGRILHQGDWQFFRLRPGNFPTARLASMCFLFPRLFEQDGFRDMIRIVKDETLVPRDRVRGFVRLFAIQPDEFWSHRYRFAQGPASRGVALGPARINDLLINCCLPVTLLYARLFKDHVVRRSAQEILGCLPLLQQNAVTKCLERQLLKNRFRFASAFEQQGGIHLFKFFCSPARCALCDVGDHLGLVGGR